MILIGFKFGIGFITAVGLTISLFDYVEEYYRNYKKKKDE